MFKIIFTLIYIALFIFIIRSISTGVIVRGKTYIMDEGWKPKEIRRDTNPIEFWIEIIMYSVALLVALIVGLSRI